MKTFWKKHKISISIGTFILIVAPLFFWMSLFMVKRIQNKADLIQQKIIDNDLERKKIEKIPQMEETDAGFEKKKKYVGTILSASSKVDFIEYVEALASETNNQIEIKILNDNQSGPSAKSGTKVAVKKTKPDEEKNIEEQLSYKQYISMQVDLTGDYESFLNFAHQLENNKYYVTILSLNLKTGILDKENSSQNSGSNDVFFSPALSSQNNAMAKEGEKRVLKSTLTIIVYTE